MLDEPYNFHYIATIPFALRGCPIAVSLRSSNSALLASEAISKGKGFARPGGGFERHVC
jgi:hypothetical protein